jgi:hypothetical protein
MTQVESLAKYAVRASFADLDRFTRGGFEFDNQ